jgi:hypothetical protein
MARPEKNNVDYFPFFCKEGKSMFYIEQKYGNDGFATWVKLLRELAVTEYHYLDLSKEINAMYLSAKCRVDKQVLECIILDLVKLGQFDEELWDDYCILYSEKFVNSVQDAYSRRTNEIVCKKTILLHLQDKCIQKPDKCIQKPDICILEVDSNTQSKVNKSKVNKSNIKNIKKESRIIARNKPTPKQLYPDVDFECEEEYKPILQEWFTYKREKKQAYTAAGRPKIYKKLVQLSGDNISIAQKIVDQSISAPWSGLFPLVEESQKKNGFQSNTAGTRNSSSKKIDYSKVKVRKMSEE